MPEQRLACPSCDREMDRVKRGPARFWRCGGCGAHALSETSLRRIVPPPVWTAIWPGIREARVPGRRRCPACGRAMGETRDLSAASDVRLDACDPCGLVWFDSHELDRVPKVPVPEEPPRLPPEAARLLAKALAEEYDAREATVFLPLREFAVAILYGLLRGLWRR
ncbi:MAG: zf-TFIIB domain-containing protein [Planctomycetes bacterium]|nr:zf-TFIIB domain-containing protein [Planctomycetota bacterium]